jgi:hypothetical protein
MGRCEFCGARAPVAPVHYRQNTGMLVVRQSKAWAGDACRGCGLRWFWKTTLHTFFLGWWGTISCVLTPIFLLGNLYSLTKTLGLPTAAAQQRQALEDQREYARNLATKDGATTVEVLSRATGTPPADVEAFLSTLT